jgi:DNA-binding ferritin-like protein (Dps family)
MNKRKQMASYRAKTNEISKKLSVKNRKFFEDLREYLLFSSVFYDEYVVVGQVYEIANDLLEAQNQGEEAQEYFGTNPQKIADELLRNTPKSSFMNQLSLLFIMIGISWLIKLISDFSSNSVQLNLFSYITTAMYSIFIVISFFFVMKKTIYLKKSFIANKTKRFLILWLVALLWIGGSVLLNLFTPDIWLVTISFQMM